MKDQDIRMAICKRRIELGKEPKFIFINPKTLPEIVSIYITDSVVVDGKSIYPGLSALQYSINVELLYGLKIEEDSTLPVGEIKVI